MHPLAQEAISLACTFGEYFDPYEFQDFILKSKFIELPLSNLRGFYFLGLPCISSKLSGMQRRITIVHELLHAYGLRSHLLIRLLSRLLAPHFILESEYGIKSKFG